MGKTYFTEEDVRAHVEKHMPNCPGIYRLAIIARVSRNPQRHKRLGRVVGSIATNYIRHELTDYETLMHVQGLSRSKARKVIRAEVGRIFSFWRGLPGPKEQSDREMG